MIEQLAMELNQALRGQSRPKILEILGHPDIERILRVEDQNKHTPFFWACSSLSEELAAEVVPRFLEKGVDPLKLDKYSQNVLYYIAKNGNPKLLSYLLKNYKYDLNTNDYNKQTPLFFAVSNGHLECARILIENGADVNHQDSNGQNCLFWSAAGGHLDVCKCLVNSNINFNKVDGNKEMAIHYARKNRHQHVLNYLQELRSTQKKTKEMAVKMESSQQEEKVIRKKKELLKQKYCLVYTSPKGEVHELTPEQLDQFANTSDNNKTMMDLIQHPEKLESMAMPEEKKYEKVAMKILNYFVKHEQGSLFLQPVDYVALKIPNYPVVVKTPMDFSTIRTKLSYNSYDSEEDFHADMMLVFDNCILFNGIESPYGKIATQMKLEFQTMYKKQFGF